MLDRRDGSRTSPRGLADTGVGARLLRSSRASCRSPAPASCRSYPGYLSFITGERTQAEGERGARARCRCCCSSSGSRSCSPCSGRSPPRFVSDLQGSVGSAVGGRDRDRAGRRDDRVRVRTRLVRAVRRAASVARQGPARRGGRAAAGDGVRGRMDAVHRPGARRDPRRSQRTREHRRGAFLLVSTPWDSGRPFLLIGLGVQRLVGRARLGPAALPARSRRCRAGCSSRWASCS